MKPTIEEIAQEILENYDFDRYQPISVEVEPPEVDGVMCTWCGHFAPLGVPILHTDDCSKPTRRLKWHKQ